jgi:hypothetical protein
MRGGVEAKNPERRVGPERLRERGGARSVDRVALEVGIFQCRVVGSERLRERRRTLIANKVDAELRALIMTPSALGLTANTELCS